MTDPNTGASVNNNRIRRIVDNVDPSYTTDYQYDNYNRLTNAQAGGYSRYYQYDAWGNINNFSAVTLNYATNATGAPATNRLTSDSVGYSYSYDEAGNMTVGMGQSYAYDAANRMKTAGNGSSAYGYDGDGKRVRVTENGATTFYVGSTALAHTAMEVNSAGILRAYVYSGGRLVAVQATDGQFYWIHANHLNSSRATTDLNGNLTYKGQFDPYGQTVSEWSASGNNNLNKKKFTGYERDTATGLDYAGARMYNSGRGRFVQVDPIGLAAVNKSIPESLNRYSYSGNDPINFSDPTGESYQDVYDAIARSCCQSAGGTWVIAGFNSVGMPTYTCQVSSSGGAGGSGGSGGGGQNGPLIVKIGLINQTGVAGFEELFASMIDKGDCNSFVSGLIDKVATSTNRKAYSNDAKVLLDTIFRQGSISILNNPTSGGRSAGGIPTGYISDGNAGIEIKAIYRPVNIPQDYIDRLEYEARAKYAFTALHELIHHAGGDAYYYDKDLAKVLIEAGLITRPVNLDDAFDASGAWNDVLSQHCSVPPYQK